MPIFGLDNFDFYRFLWTPKKLSKLQRKSITKCESKFKLKIFPLHSKGCASFPTIVALSPVFPKCSRCSRNLEVILMKESDNVDNVDNLQAGMFYQTWYMWVKMQLSVRPNHSFLSSAQMWALSVSTFLARKFKLFCIDVKFHHQILKLWFFQNLDFMRESLKLLKLYLGRTLMQLQ